MNKWISQIDDQMPAGISAACIDIRTADGFEISHSRGDYPDWSRALGRDTIVAYRVR